MKRRKQWGCFLLFRFSLFVLVFAGENVPAVADGLSDLLEDSNSRKNRSGKIMEDVVEEFFKGTGYFEPGMPPCVSAIDVLLEGDMLNDVGRMA